MHPRSAVLTRVTRDEGKNNVRVDGDPSRGSIFVEQGSKIGERKREKEITDRF